MLTLILRGSMKIQ